MKKYLVKWKENGWICYKEFSMETTAIQWARWATKYFENRHWVEVEMKRSSFNYPVVSEAGMPLN